MVKSWLHRKLFSINGYILVGLVLVLIVSMPFLYKNIMDAYRNSVFEQFQTHIREEAGLLSDVMAMLNMEKRDEINRIIESALLKGLTTHIDVVDRDGNVIFAAEMAEHNTLQPIEDNMVAGNEDDVYYLFLPIRFADSDIIHTLRVGFDESSIQDEYADLRRKVYTIMVVYTLALVLLLATATRLILKPLRELRQQSRFIAEGDIDAPLQISTRLKDIEYLAKDLELMRGSLVEMAERMQHKATHDDLTGLPNRFLFNDRLKSAIYMSQREGLSFAVLLIDLDRFKEINDTLGHGVGDEILKAISERMLEEIRGSDTLARIGGDEFCMILMGVEQIVAEKLALKIIEATEPPIHVGGYALKIGASIGISVFPQDGAHAEILMQRADVAMYNSKRSNLRISCYHQDMDGDSYENLVLTNDMRNAIEDGQFHPMFQPKINLASNQFCGCEALLRWQHPDFGMISPDKFIALAEQENLTGLLTEWMMREYFSSLNSIFPPEMDCHVSINVSPNDLIDHSLFDAMIKVVEESNFPPSRLFVEVTENAIMKNPQRSADILSRFHNAGIRVSVDDFGTGYSSLAYLQKFPISELKIDKSFIMNLTRDSNNYPIVNATITMAHDLGIAVVAEGVEDEATLALLRELNCDRAQGYLIGRPMEYDKFSEWFSKRETG